MRISSMRTSKFTTPIIVLLLMFPMSVFAKPAIGLSKAFWDMGVIQEGDELHETLTLTNTGDKPLEVNIRPSCDCIRISYSHNLIEPGKSAPLSIHFRADDSSGKKDEYLFIETNDPDNPSVTWLIESYVDASKKVLPITAARGIPAPSDVRQSLSVEIYSTPGCSFCKKIKEQILPALSQKHAVAITAIAFPLDVPKNYERLVSLEKQLNRTSHTLPVVLIDGNILGGKNEINKGLENLIIEATRRQIQGTSTADPLAESTRQDIEGRIRSLTFLPLIAAALIDGINPCAFAGIIFLVSCLGMINKRPTSEVFFTGITYILGIFVVYFLIGIGLSKAFLAVNSLKMVTRILYFLAGAGTFTLSIISFYDWYSLGKTNDTSPNKVILQLPNILKTKMRMFIGKFGDVKYIVPFGFFLGAIISILEFFCTGQIYLPTIMYMVRIPELKARALFYLALYAFIFVVPLIVILVSVIGGLKYGKIKVFGKGGTRIVKLLTGSMFLLLSILIFMSSL